MFAQEKGKKAAGRMKEVEFRGGDVTKRLKEKKTRGGDR